MKNRVKILNVAIVNITQEELLAQLKKGVLVTPNVDQIVKMQKDREYYDIVRRAEWCVCDSKILYLCSRLLGHPLPEAIPGSSFFPAFCDYHKDDLNCKIFLLGAMEGVSKKAMDRINSRIGRPIVVGAYSPSYGFEKKQDENEEIYRMINSSGANVVLVGVGCPKQEKWIYENYEKYDGTVSVCAGATVDFLAGNINRAPVWMSEHGLEWLYRFSQEPKRLFKRYFVEDIKIMKLVVKYWNGGVQP